jgi:hypothetical protein
LEIAARRGGRERQMHRPLFDRAFRAWFIHIIKAAGILEIGGRPLSVKLSAKVGKNYEK